MISPNINNYETVRNVYIIDPEGIIRLILIYPMNIGRCIPEILRCLEALQVSDKCKASTPANWTLGAPLINPIPQTFNELEKKSEMLKNEKNGMNWYLSFKNPEDCKQNSIKNSEMKKLEDKKYVK